LLGEQKQIRKGIIEICWYMRGSISMQEAYDLTWEDNKDIQEFLKDNMDRFKGSMTPVV
jgi:hypothetical protein|tara:strand:+ start:1227 stop:1403 length:177 start_codon:yes stop_codon:yes gene_type:complete